MTERELQVLEIRERIAREKLVESIKDAVDTINRFAGEGSRYVERLEEQDDRVAIWERASWFINHVNNMSFNIPLDRIARDAAELAKIQGMKQQLDNEINRKSEEEGLI